MCFSFCRSDAGITQTRAQLSCHTPRNLARYSAKTHQSESKFNIDALLWLVYALLANLTYLCRALPAYELFGDVLTSREDILAERDRGDRWIRGYRRPKDPGGRGNAILNAFDDSGVPFHDPMSTWSI